MTSLRAVCCGFLLSYLGTSLAGPANDDFKNRRQLFGTNGVVSADFTGSTVEPHEPSVGLPWSAQAASQSIWWSWEAPYSGGLELSAQASSFAEKWLVVYSGDTVSNLTQLAHAGYDGKAVLSIEKGKTYAITITTAVPVSGTAVLWYESFPVAGNDDFAHRIKLSGPSVDVEGSVADATLETDEPMPPFGSIAGSVWWEWTAPEDGRVWIESGTGADFFHGSTLNSLEPIEFQSATVAVVRKVTRNETIVIRNWPFWGSNAGKFRLRITSDPGRFTSPLPGSTFERPARVPLALNAGAFAGSITNFGFHIVYSCGNGDTVWSTNLANPPWQAVWEDPRPGEFRAYAVLKLNSGAERYYSSECFSVFNPRPQNDNMADAAEIPPEGGTFAITRLNGATLEPGEVERLWPETALGSPGTVWWRWIPEKSGNAAITHSSGLVLRVFAGQSLTPVSLFYGSKSARFSVTAGSEYFVGFRASSFFSQPLGPDISFAVHAGRDPNAPPNDDFRDCVPLPSSGDMVTDTSNASVEPAEANHPLRLTQPSVWWSWTAPANGKVQLQAQARVSNNLLLVFRGDSLTNLTSLDSQSFWGQPFTRNVTNGETLLIRGGADNGGLYRIKADFSTTLENDLFQARKNLSALPVIERVSMLGNSSSTELGEPLPRDFSSASQSAWWSWTATRSETVVCAIHVLAGSAAISIFTGDSLSSLIPASGRTNLTGLFFLSAVAGQAYQIQVVGGANADMILYMGSAPERNDNLANASDLPVPTKTTVVVNNYLATHESGENNKVGGSPPFSDLTLSGSLWWRWTAPSDGVLTLSHQPLLWVIRRAWVGNNINDLQRVPGEAIDGQQWSVGRMPVFGGNTYSISIDTVAHTFTGEPLPQAILLSNNFTSLHIAAPFPRAAFAAGASIPIQVGPISPQYDGDVHEVTLIFDQKINGVWNRMQHPRSEILLSHSPFSTILTNWPSGTFRVTLRAFNTQLIPRESASLEFLVTPENDSFSKRPTAYAFEGPNYFFPRPHFAGQLAGGGVEEFERTLLPQGVSASFWWQWQAVWSGPVLIQSQIPVSIFSGTNETDLAPIAYSAGGPFQFAAKAGAFYQIALLPRSNDNGLENVHFTIEPAPPNDDFANRTALAHVENHPTGRGTEYPFYTLHSALESSEPDHGLGQGSGTVWFTLTPERDGIFQIWPGPFREETNAAVRLYQGDALSALQSVRLALSEEWLTATLEAGTPYQIAIVAPPGRSPTGILQVTFRSLSPNDDFSDRQQISGDSLNLNVPLWFATIQPNEPQPPSPLARSVWWKWTAPRTGRLNVIVPTATPWSWETSGLIVDLFAGSELETLDKIESEYIRSTFEGYLVYNYQVTAETTYTIRSGVRDEWGMQYFSSFRLELARDWPLNDSVPNAKPLVGNQLQLESHTAGSVEGDLWYTWRAPHEGLLRLKVSPSATNVSYQISQRDNSTNFWTVASLTEGFVTVHVRQDEEIRILARSELPNKVAFDLDLIAAAPNDDPASSRTLSAPSGQFFADPINQAWGHFGTNGELLHDRQLYWTWTAPFGGTLQIEPSDGSRNLNVTTLPAGPAPVRVVAGRTYTFLFTGREPRAYKYWIEPDPWQIDLDLNRATGMLRFYANGPGNTVFRLDHSSNLNQWNQLNYYSIPSGPRELEIPIQSTGVQFFRLVPMF